MNQAANDLDIVSRSSNQPEVQPDIARQAPTADLGVSTGTQGPRRRVNRKAGGPLAVSPQAYGLSSYNTAPALKPRTVPRASTAAGFVVTASRSKR